MDMLSFVQVPSSVSSSMVLKAKKIYSNLQSMGILSLDIGDCQAFTQNFVGEESEDYVNSNSPFHDMKHKPEKVQVP